MNETIRCGDADPIHQGDILRLFGSDDISRAPEYAVVINADCDLEHGKVDGIISALPVYSFRTYLEMFWVGGHLASELARSTSWLVEQCQLDPDDADSLHRWIRSEAPLSIAGKLIAASSVQPKKHQDVHYHLNRCAMLLSQRGMKAFEQLCRQEVVPEKYARKHVESAKTSIGDGHFFLSDIAGAPDVGHVIRMRRILSIEEARCYRSEAALLAHHSDGLGAARVARLTPTYQYRVAQLFAYQFSRIGLPDEITALSSLAVDDIVKEVSSS